MMMRRAMLPLASVAKFSLRHCVTVAAANTDVTKTLKQLQAGLQVKADPKKQFRSSVNQFGKSKAQKHRNALGKAFLEMNDYAEVKKAALTMQKKRIAPLPAEARHLARVMLANVESLTAQDKDICRKVLNSVLFQRGSYSKLFTEVDHLAVLEMVVGGHQDTLQMKVLIPAYLMQAGNLFDRPEIEEMLKENGFSDSDLVHLKMEHSLAQSDFEALVNHYHSLPAPTVFALAILIKSCANQLKDSSADTREQFKKLADRALAQGQDEPHLKKRVLQGEHKNFMNLYRAFSPSKKNTDKTAEA